MFLEKIREVGVGGVIMKRYGLLRQMQPSDFGDNYVSIFHSLFLIQNCNVG